MVVHRLQVDNPKRTVCGDRVSQLSPITEDTTTNPDRVTCTRCRR
ncbi:hypothetical protein ACN27G_05925 [Plantactinospora sp. WMMB334]